MWPRRSLAAAALSYAPPAAALVVVLAATALPGEVSAQSERRLPEGFTVDQSPEARAERHVTGASRRHRSERTWIPRLVVVGGLLLITLALLAVKGPAWLARRRLDSNAIAAPSLSFRGHQYSAHELNGHTVQWRSGPGRGARASPAQIARAKVAFAHMASVLSSAAAELKRSHGAWVDDPEVSAERLASEMKLDGVTVYLAADSAIVYAHHPNFSGHFAEIDVDAQGRVTHASLAG